MATFVKDVYMLEIIKYNSQYKSEWDEFVKGAKNGSFLFLRDYMEYHSDRFTDFSLVALKDGKICGLLPANIKGETVYSHQGLTYGGWVTSAKGLSAPEMLEMWSIMKDFLRAEGVKKLVYKSMPHIYHIYPAEEDLYALFLSNAKIETTLISSVLDLQHRLPFDRSPRRGINSALQNGVKVCESDDYAGFWDVLCERLHDKYDSKPVHSLQEMLLLKSRFPENIRLFTAVYEGEIVAGIILYLSETAAKAQYCATTENGRKLRVLPAMYDHILNSLPETCRYFDFGTSNEDGGKILNNGLINQKYSYGGRAVVYTTYSIEI